MAIVQTALVIDIDVDLYNAEYGITHTPAEASEYVRTQLVELAREHLDRVGGYATVRDGLRPVKPGSEG